MSLDISLFSSLPDRDLRREGFIVGEGRLLAQRLAARCKLLGVLAEQSAAEEAEKLASGTCPVQVLPAVEIEKLVGYAFHRGILVLAERPAIPAFYTSFNSEVSDRDAPLGSYRRLVILPKITDPENLGTIIRSAASLGWDALVLGSSSCDPYGRRALRCSMGASLVLPLFLADSAQELTLLRGQSSDNSWTIVAAELEPGAQGPKSLGSIEKLALLLGNEREGLSADWRQHCDFTVAIPQESLSGVDSLNVAAAAAILLWEGHLVKQTQLQRQVLQK
ncbi:RNA methyltransferase [Treponema sp.]